MKYFTLLLVGMMTQFQIATAQLFNFKKDFVVTITTDLGNIDLILYDQTPNHKANFLKLVDEGFYDSTAFHRVINNFMIQGGDPNSKPGGDDSKIGRGGPGYTLEAEIVDSLKHVKGSLAAARLGDAVNPEKRSSGSQFYIVHASNGTPHLDGAYTVFGEVIAGVDIVDKIAQSPIDGQNRPKNPIYIKMHVNKMRQKKITKIYDYHYKQ